MPRCQDEIGKRSLYIRFASSHLKYHPESVFKPTLYNQDYDTRITFSSHPHGTGALTIDCSGCRNHWFVIDKRNEIKNQVEAYCKEHPDKALFDEDIIEKLKEKCK